MVIANNLVTDKLVINAIKQNLAIIRFDLNRKVAYVNDLFATNSRLYSRRDV